MTIGPFVLLGLLGITFHLGSRPPKQRVQTLNEVSGTSSYSGALVGATGRRICSIIPEDVSIMPEDSASTPIGCDRTDRTAGQAPMTGRPSIQVGVTSTPDHALGGGGVGVTSNAGNMAARGQSPEGGGMGVTSNAGSSLTARGQAPVGGGGAVTGNAGSMATQGQALAVGGMKVTGTAGNMTAQLQAPRRKGGARGIGTGKPRVTRGRSRLTAVVNNSWVIHSRHPGSGAGAGVGAGVGAEAGGKTNPSTESPDHVKQPILARSVRSIWKAGPGDKTDQEQVNSGRNCVDGRRGRGGVVHCFSISIFAG